LQISGKRNWLRDFLNVYWLRPENALWRALNCKSLEGLEVKSPSLDLSCGDGIFSFMLNGGNFETTFDIFEGTGELDEFYEHTDIYDAAPIEYNPAIEVRPNASVTVGTDWKPNLLNKAEKLDFYQDLVHHDNNDPLPFEDDRFQTVYSNSVYWVENIDMHLSEIRRVLATDGKAILQLKTTASKEFLEMLHVGHGDQIGTDLIDIIDRGRSSHYAHLYDDAGWTNRLVEAGLNIVERRLSVTWVHLRMWDIGLRPISPHLIRMANSLHDEQRRVIKEDWIETWEKLLLPFYHVDFNLGRQKLPPEICYIVEPVE
jgi:SAM-dependent methyltransferase